jgi:DNA-binding CsgD family transcriptional regulator
MALTADENVLFADHAGIPDGVVVINDRCRLLLRGGYQVATVCGLPLAHFAASDKAGEAHAMVCLVDLGWAQQIEVARAFGCDVRTVRRHQRRFEEGGLCALGRPRGFPRGRARVPQAREDAVNGWKAEGVSNREIARRLGINEKAVRKLVKRLGWKERSAEQMTMPFESADPKLSASGERRADDALADANPTLDPGDDGGREGADPKLSASGERRADDAHTDANPTLDPGDDGGQEGADPKLSASGERRADGAHTDANLTLDPGDDGGQEGADPKLSAPVPDQDRVPLSLDLDPADRAGDRLLARLGLLNDAAPVFGAAAQVPGLGALLAIPALVDSGVLSIAREIYGSIGPAFYGLRTTLVTLLLMALLRIKRPEGLKEHSPRLLGQILGLDRAPEVKTLRGKLARLAAHGRAGDFGRALARHRVAARGHAMGFLYVDGHVRAYHGGREIPKTHLARMRIAMPATTDYWINDAQSEPLFVVPTEANKGLVAMLPIVLEEVRKLLGDRRVTVVFDRGGWSPRLFAKLIADGFDILTYRKAPYRPVPVRKFTLIEETVHGKKIKYLLADQRIYLEYGRKKKRKRVFLRQVTRLSDNGHQTPIITSRRDLSTLEVACRMFDRWRQENFFKYLREEFALDALVDYGTELADATREVPNPERSKIKAELRKANAHLEQLQAHYGLTALENQEDLRPTMRGFKIANAESAARIRAAMARITDLETQRATIPTRVPVQEVVEADVIKLSVERKHLTDILKMVAYQAEGELLRLLSPYYRRTEQEGRTLIHTALSAGGDIQVTNAELLVSIDPLSSPHKTQALAAVCEQLNLTSTHFPGTNLKMRFAIKPEPPRSLAFPGARDPASGTQPDI